MPSLKNAALGVGLCRLQLESGWLGATAAACGELLTDFRKKSNVEFILYWLLNISYKIL